MVLEHAWNEQQIKLSNILEEFLDQSVMSPLLSGVLIFYVTKDMSVKC